MWYMQSTPIVPSLGIVYLNFPCMKNCRDVDVYMQLGESKAALGRLQGRSIAIPSQGLLINNLI